MAYGIMGRILFRFKYSFCPFLVHPHEDEKPRMYCPHYHDLFLHDDFCIFFAIAFVGLSDNADFAYCVFNQLTRISGGLLWQCVQVLGMGVDVYCYSFVAKSVGM
jgi:hypothetical protein